MTQTPLLDDPTIVTAWHLRGQARQITYVAKIPCRGRGRAAAQLEPTNRLGARDARSAIEGVPDDPSVL